MYGYEIMRELESRSEGYFSMTAALLYPALHQLEADGFVESEWEEGQGRRLESSEEDPRFGEGQDGEEQVMDEMGDPGEMARGMRRLHWSGRLGDLLWALVPYYLINQIGIFVYNSTVYRPGGNPEPSNPVLYILFRLYLLAWLVMIWVSWKRRSPVLMIFWTVDTIGMLISQMTMEQRWIPGNELVGPVWESYLLLAGLAVLLYWLYHVLRGQHFDLLLVVFALLPLAGLAANWGTVNQVMSSDITQNSTSTLIMSIGSRVVRLAGISGFFLLGSRESRWFSLVLLAVNQAVPNLALYYSFPGVAAMWLGVIGLVLAAWALDVRSRRPDNRIVD
jgi:hypothetical protein